MTRPIPLYAIPTNAHGPAGLEQSVSLDVATEDDEALEALLAPHDREPGEWLEALNAGIRAHGFWPWAVVLFEREFQLSGHVRTTRRSADEVLFSAYALRPGVTPWTHGAPPVSILLFRDKQVAADHADSSPLFEAAWRAVSELPVDGQWLTVAGSPPEDWVRETEAGDELLFDRAN